MQLIFAVTGTEVTTIGAALIAAASGVLATLRQRSGRAAHTDAQDLWTEARSLRDGWRSDVEDQRIEIAKLQLRIRDLETEAMMMRRKLSTLEGQHEECTAALAALRSRLA